MKMKQFPRKKQDRTRGSWKWHLRYERLKVFRHERFAFGEWIDDGRPYYKKKYLCFNCCKLWRSTDRHTSLEVCPECSGGLRRVGQMFRTPRRADKRSWRKLKEILKP